MPVLLLTEILATLKGKSVKRSSLNRSSGLRDILHERFDFKFLLWSEMFIVRFFLFSMLFILFIHS